MEGRKEEKGKEIKGKAIWPKRSEVPVSHSLDGAIMKNCVIESKQKRREKLRE